MGSLNKIICWIFRYIVGLILFRKKRVYGLIQNRMIFVNFPKKKLSLPKLKLVQFASILKENHNL